MSVKREMKEAELCRLLAQVGIRVRAADSLLGAEACKNIEL